MELKTLAHEQYGDIIKTVIDIHGPRLPVVEVKVAQETIDFGAVMTEVLPDGLLPANATNQK